MRLLFITVFQFACVFAGWCGGIEKAYQALSVYDYFKARQIFYQQLDKHTAAAAYGLATIYYRNDNPFHHLDSAYKYAALGRDHYSLLPAGKRLQLNKQFALSDTALLALHDSICSKAFARLMNKASIEAAETYLGTYHRSPYAYRVLCLRDSFIFHGPDRKLTVEAFTQYLRTYPQSCYLTDSRNLLEFALYMETTAPKTDSAYLTYLTQYPKGKYRSYAKEELLNYYVKTRQATGIYAFIKDFGSSHPTTYAWNMLLGIEAPHHTRAEFQAFLDKYPDYPKREEIEEEFVYWNTPFLLIRQNDKHGFCDSTGRQMIEPAYSDAENFSEGYALVQKEDLYGYINKAGKTKIEFQYTEASSFSNHVAIVQKDKRYFLIDYSNKVLSAKYDDIADFSEGIAIVKKNNQYGAINLNGQEIVKPAFDLISDYAEGLAVFLKNGKYGYLDKQGFVAIAPLYDWVSPFRNGQARAQLNKQYGVINRKGDFVIAPDYDLIDEPHQGVYLLVKNNLYGFADSSGCLASEIKYTYQPAYKTASLTDGKYVRAITAKKQELLTINGGRYFTDHVFDEVSLPVNNFVVARERGKVNIYHLSKPAFARRSLLDARSDGRYWYLENKKGWNVYDSLLDKLLLTLESNTIAHFGGPLFIAESEEGKGLVDIIGSEVLPSRYDEISFSPVKNIVYVERNEKGAYFHVSARSFIWKEDGFDSL